MMADEKANPVEVDPGDLALLLNAAGRYVAGSEQPPPSDRWRQWFVTMMRRYAEAAGYEVAVQSMPMDAPEGQA
jgi:hypothetical protein